MLQATLNRSRNDKFLLVLDLPNALKNSQDTVIQNKYSADQIQFTVFGSPVPKISIPEIVLPFGGQTMKVSSNFRSAYPTLDVKFLVGNGYQNYWILWKWLNLFNDSENSTSEINAPASFITEKDIRLTNPFSNYISNFTLFALDEFDNKIISFKYTNAFVTSLGQINYSYQDPTEITCDISFAYSQLHVELLKDINISSC
jgi:hypothetical protein